MATRIIHFNYLLVSYTDDSFYSLTLSLENTRPYWKSNLVLLFFFFMAIIGFLRWFFVKETYLLVYYSRFWKRDRFYYQGIQKICSLPNGIELTYKNKTHHFLMRKKRETIC